MPILTTTPAKLDATKLIYAYDDEINQLAINMMKNMAEANIEMVCDMAEEYPTKQDIERVFEGLHDQAIDTVEDMFDELKTKLLARLQTIKYTAKVRQLEYTEMGKLNEITIKLDIVE